MNNVNSYVGPQICWLDTLGSRRQHVENHLYKGYCYDQVATKAGFILNGWYADFEAL